MSKYNPEGSLAIIEEVDWWDVATVRSAACADWYKSGSQTAYIFYKNLCIESAEVDAVHPQKKLIKKNNRFDFLPHTGPKLKPLSKEELEQKIVSNFDTMVNNKKAWYSVILDYVCCCKKSSISKTKIMAKKYDDFFNDLYQKSYDFTDSNTDLLGVTDEASNI